MQLWQLWLWADPHLQNMHPESRIHTRSPSISYEIHIPPLLELPLTALDFKGPGQVGTPAHLLW